MGRQLSEKELKRFGRVLAGHMQDKDRARRKRKAKGEAAARAGPRKGASDDHESLEQALAEAAEDER
jgi:hypothetical protein